MKVVLFCGGEGLRMRSGPSDDLPKTYGSAREPADPLAYYEELRPLGS